MIMISRRSVAAGEAVCGQVKCADEAGATTILRDLSGGTRPALDSEGSRLSALD